MFFFYQMRILPVLLPFSFLCIAYAKLVQVQILHRHGARSLIDKHETDPRLEQSSPSLYPAGVQQLQRLGSYCHSQYVSGSAPSRIDDLNPDSDLHQQVYSRTSNFQRTQLSARAFLSGLFPVDYEQIPTLVFNGTETDWIIRGYALCPVLAERFKEFVAEDTEYQKKKSDNEPFVERLAKGLGYSDDDATFENIFNIYDQYNIINNGYDENYEDSDKIPPDDMTKLKELADWYESHKFFFATHNVHVAGALLARVLQHARRVVQRSTESYRIVHFSAHYPTLLTLFASMRAKNEGGVKWPADKIPEFGAALIFEVHEEEGELWVRMKWYRGGEGDVEVRNVAIGRGDCVDGEKGCRLSSMERLLALDTLREEKFCSDCQSTSGVCEFMRRSEGGDVVQGSEVCSVGTKVTSGAIGGVVVLAVGLVAWFLHSFCVGKKKRVGMERTAMDGLDSSGYDGAVYA